MLDVGYTKNMGQNGTFIGDKGLTGCHFSV